VEIRRLLRPEVSEALADDFFNFNFGDFIISHIKSEIGKSIISAISNFPKASIDFDAFRSSLLEMFSATSAAAIDESNSSAAPNSAALEPSASAATDSADLESSAPDGTDSAALESPAPDAADSVDLESSAPDGTDSAALESSAPDAADSVASD
jgi:hypothetical protein